MGTVGGDDDSGATGTSDSDSGDGGGTEQPDVELLNHELYEDDFSTGVEGTARNNTDRELSYVEVTTTFLDADGTQIGEGLDNVSELAAGREWEFDTIFTGDEPSRIDSYEIEVSTGL